MERSYRRVHSGPWGLISLHEYHLEYGIAMGVESLPSCVNFMCRRLLEQLCDDILTRSSTGDVI